MVQLTARPQASTRWRVAIALSGGISCLAAITPAAAGSTPTDGVSRYVFALRHTQNETEDPDPGCPLPDRGRPFADGTYEALIAYAPSRQDVARLIDSGAIGSWVELRISWTWEGGQLRQATVQATPELPALKGASSFGLPPLVLDLLLPWEAEVPTGSNGRSDRYEVRLLDRLCTAADPVRGLFVHAVPLRYLLRLENNGTGIELLGLFLDPARWARQAPLSIGALLSEPKPTAIDHPSWVRVRNLTRTALAASAPLADDEKGSPSTIEASGSSWIPIVLFLGGGGLVTIAALVAILKVWVTRRLRLISPPALEPIIWKALPPAAPRAASQEPPAFPLIVAPELPTVAEELPPEVPAGDTVAVASPVTVRALDRLAPFMEGEDPVLSLSVFDGCATLQDFADALVTQFFATKAEPLDTKALMNLGRWLEDESEGTLLLITPSEGEPYDSAHHTVAAHRTVELGILNRAAGVIRPGLVVNGEIRYKAKLILTA